MKNNNVTVIFHSRKKFYNGTPIYWYEFMNSENDVEFDDLIPSRFLNIPLTVFYEYGGTHEQAIEDLTLAGFSDIVEGNEI